MHCFVVNYFHEVNNKLWLKLKGQCPDNEKQFAIFHKAFDVRGKCDLRSKSFYPKIKSPSQDIFRWTGAEIAKGNRNFHSKLVFSFLFNRSKCVFFIHFSFLSDGEYIILAFLCLSFKTVQCRKIS